MDKQRPVSTKVDVIKEEREGKSYAKKKMTTPFLTSAGGELIFFLNGK